VSFGHRRLIRSGLYFWDDRDSFAVIIARKPEVEESFGDDLVWETPEGRKYSRVCVRGEGDITESATHDTLLAWCIDTQRRLREAIAAVMPVS
jgi:hypothetical protein